MFSRAVSNARKGELTNVSRTDVITIKYTYRASVVCDASILRKCPSNNSEVRERKKTEMASARMQ